RVELVRDAMDGDRNDAGVGEEDLVVARRGGIAFVSGLDVFEQRGANGGETRHERFGDLAAARLGVLADARGDLGREPRLERGEQRARAVVSTVVAGEEEVDAE